MLCTLNNLNLGNYKCTTYKQAKTDNDGTQKISARPSTKPEIIAGNQNRTHTKEQDLQHG